MLIIKYFLLISFFCKIFCNKIYLKINIKKSRKYFMQNKRIMTNKKIIQFIYFHLKHKNNPQSILKFNFRTLNYNNFIFLKSSLSHIKNCYNDLIL
jgi:hypothetical protein